MPDFTVIEGRDNVIDLDKRLDADLDGSEESKLLTAIKEIRGEDINAVIIIGFKKDGGLDLRMTSNVFDVPANVVYAAEVMKTVILDNAEF